MSYKAHIMRITNCTWIWENTESSYQFKYDEYY